MKLSGNSAAAKTIKKKPIPPKKESRPVPPKKEGKPDVIQRPVTPLLRTELKKMLTPAQQIELRKSLKEAVMSESVRNFFRKTLTSE